MEQLLPFLQTGGFYVGFSLAIILSVGLIVFVIYLTVVMGKKIFNGNGKTQPVSVPANVGLNGFNQSELLIRMDERDKRMVQILEGIAASQKQTNLAFEKHMQHDNEMFRSLNEKVIEMTENIDRFCQTATHHHNNRPSV